MYYHLTRLGFDAVLQPERAARILAALYVRFRGKTVDVAEHLGVSTSTVKRWVALLEDGGHFIRSDIERVRRRRRSGLDG